MVTRGDHAIDQSNAHKIKYVCTIHTHEFNLFFLVAHLVLHPLLLASLWDGLPTNVNVLVTQRIPDFRTKEIYLFFGKKNAPK
jgi:hypothetical protein